MRRRDFIAGTATTIALGFARSVGAQTNPSSSKRIAIISPSRSVDELQTHPYFRSFLDELGRRGFVEGKSLTVDRYSGHGQTGTYASIVRTVLSTDPDTVFSYGPQLVSMLKSSTKTIPIVAIVDDPVAEGLASSLARPGANLTGVTVDAGLELYGKRLALLVEARPNASVVGYLSSSHNWRRPAGAAVREAAQQAQITLANVDLGDSFNEATYTAAFDSMASARIDLLLVSDEPEHNTNAKTLINLAAKTRVPTMYPFRDLAVAGGLMTYCIDLLDAFRYAGGQVAEILLGKNPSEMPIYQPTKFQLIINTKAAQQIGLDMPASLLARADEVIE